MTSHHDRLWSVCKKLDADYSPYGNGERLGADCSGGCMFYYPLADKNGEAISNDWGVCTNQRSHRCSMLTFEHQGCQHFQGSRRAIRVEDLSDEEMQAIIDAKVPPESDYD